MRSNLLMKLFAGATLTALMLDPGTNAAYAQAADAARQEVVAAANAMGGVDRLQAVRSLRLRGYGHEAYQDGGSEITTEPNAPEKVTNLTAYERVIDVANGRTQVKYSQYRAFVFAALSMMKGQPVQQGLDGDVAFDTSAAGPRRASAAAARQRQMELLTQPLMALKAALDPASKLTNLRKQGELTLIDVTTAKAAEFTLALRNDDHLPSWMKWVGPHENLGELTYRVEYSAWEPVNGVLLPMSFNTVSDFRDVVMLRLHVDRYELDIATDALKAPAEVVAAPAPVQVYTVNAEVVAPGVWLMAGNNGANSVLLEFEDHLTLFELPTNRAWSEAVIAKAKTVVPGKPITGVIISHHHFDHTGGLRPAVAEGMSLITRRGNVQWFQDLMARPVTHFPDALSRKPRALTTVPVDDHLQLKDKKLTVEVYKVVSNNHMAHGLMAYLPQYKLLIQGDLFDRGWEVYFWGDTYQANVDYRHLEVERDVPIHGQVTPIAEVRALLVKQTAQARTLCEQVASIALSMPGCPLAWDK